MNILDKILSTKRKEVDKRKERVSSKHLQNSPLFSRSISSLCKRLRQSHGPGIIAEFKRRSPSRGSIFENAQVVPVVQSYEKEGCSGISILTDTHFFGGSLNDLILARSNVSVPILRKEFIIDQFQLVEAKSAGADVILLIAEALSAREARDLAQFAKSLNLEVIMEMHSEEQLDKVNDHVDIVGINNRDLKTFNVDLEASIRLLEKLDGQFLFISESGINNPDDVIKLYSAGFQGFLIGESFMKTHKPGEALRDFLMHVNKVNSIEEE